MGSLFHLVQAIGSRVVVLGILVFVHEMGHYLAARWRGIHADAFSIGFGPSLAAWTDRRGTVWKLSLLPLGGYVKLHGMAVDVGGQAAIDREDIRHGQAFFEKSILSRAIVVAAGPIANFLLAAVIYSGVFAVLGKPVAVPNPPALVGDVASGTSAAAAGLKAGDVIRAIDGTAIATFEDMRKIVAGSPGKTLDFQIHRGAQDMDIKATIQAKPGDPATGLLGINAGGTERLERVGPLAAILAGIAETGAILWLTLSSLAHIITTGQGVHDLAGPIGVFVVSGQVAQMGIAAVIRFTAFLSINLGLVNLLPIPVLDGGHLMFYAAEAIRGRPLPARALDYGTRFGLVFIASFFLFISWNDLVHTGALRWVTHLIG